MTLSNWIIALLICSAPELCSWLAIVISSINSAVFWISGTICSINFWASIARTTLDSVISVISLAACPLFSASFLTSAATTAKPLPASPALAASMAAFKASMLVFREISWMIFIFSAMFFMAWTVSVTAFPPLMESSATFFAILFDCWAFPVFWLILALNSSIDDATSSILAACSTVPDDIELAEIEIWELLELTCPDEFWILRRTFLIFSCISAIVFIIWPISSLRMLLLSEDVKSPCSIWVILAITLSRGLNMSCLTRTFTIMADNNKAIIAIIILKYKFW